ncbi:hypothetical protein D3C87_253450 [compost metagenome]
MKVQTALTMTTLALTLAACEMKTVEPEQVSQETYGEPLKYSKVNVNLHPLNKTVCDPFGGEPSTTLEQGVKASLHYSIPGMPRLYSSEDYVTFAKKSDQSLFFADLNVPTRMFTEGFATQTNDVLKDDNGSKLIEYFGIKFETTLKLAEGDEEGAYELALLSDDGTRLKIKSGTGDNTTLKTLINNDGDHETRFGCASEVLNLTKDSAIPIEVTYYQGPRYHIANTLLWRKATAAGKDSACGRQGNEYFFDPNKASEPKQPYKDLLSRGWKVVAKENFFIPKSEGYNPCVGGTAPVITEFRLIEANTTGAYFRWVTDIPSTSQLKLVNKQTGEVILTQSDNALRTTHVVQVSNLQPDTTYTVQAASVSEDLGNALSLVIEITTPY